MSTDVCVGTGSDYASIRVHGEYCGMLRLDELRVLAAQVQNAVATLEQVQAEQNANRIRRIQEGKG